MSENGNRASGNSLTVLTPAVKESGVENVGPVAEGLKVEGQPSKAPEPSSKANSDPEKHSSEASAHQTETETSSQLQSDPALTHGSEQAQETQVTSPETSEGRTQLNAAHVNEDPSSVSATVEDVSSWTPDHEERDALTGHSEIPVSPGTDLDSFSDSYTHISPTSGSSPLPASVCQERDWCKSDEESLRKTITEDSKEVLETNRKEWDGLRKRKISQLGTLDKTEADDDDDEEEGEEEGFQPPQREEETVFSLNKCILAAVILLGLGTIFFSDADVDVKELKDPANQEWLNPEVSRDTPVGLQPPDILNKQGMEDQQILVLQAQLQQHQGELKAAQLLAEDREKERVRREELEKEYQRIKGELDRVPALQKELEQENERMKEENVRAKKELEALPSLQRELEHLRAKVSQLTQSTERTEPVHPIAASQIPPAGDKRDIPPIETQDMKHRKSWDKKGEKEQSKGDKEWKKKKSGKKEDDKERSKRGTEGERTKEQKDWKKDKSHQEGKAGKRKEWIKDKNRDDGRMGKESEDKKNFKEWQEKKEWKEDKKGKKDKHVGHDERRGDKKDWKDAGKKKGKEEKERKPRGERKEDKDWKSDKRSGGNDHKEWKGEKEWTKEKSEGKHNDKTEKKWKGEREFPKEYGGKELKEKHWREKERESKDEEWKGEGTKEEKKNKAFYHKNEGKRNPNEKEKQQKERHGHGAPDETTSHHHSGHENYWSKQRERIHHYNGQRETCSGVADCARVEGLSPVGLRDFETLLQSYLNKLQDPEEQTSREEELHKLVEEFFTDGVFAHDQMPFSEFVEDVGDILEDLAEGEESDSEGEESEEDDDDEMEEFEREAMEKFALPEEVRKGEQKKESRRVKG